VLLRIDRLSLRRVRVLGLAGSATLVLGGVVGGVVPSQDVLAGLSIVQALREWTVPAVACVFVGVTLLLLAWWRLGSLVERRDGPTHRELAVTLGWWSAPLMLATPIFSRDVFSYLALGRMTSLGAPSWAYEQGPAWIGGPLAADVPAIWQHTPAPYGPVFLSAAAKVTWVTEDSVRFGMMGMRVLALLGVALMFWSVIRIANGAGVNPGRALWLGVLNPLIVFHLVADAHNDALMLGLMLAGLALAMEGRPVIGTIAITLAALVKAPAALALVFLIQIWANQLGGSARWLRSVLFICTTAGLTVVITTAMAGTGYGWVFALDTPTLAHTWTSITTDLGHWTGVVAESLDLATRDQTTWFWRMLGLVAAGILVLFMLPPGRVTPIVGLGLGLGAVVVLGPVMHPWYLTWAIVPLAAAATQPRIRSVVVAVSIAFTLLVLPAGVQPNGAAILGAAIGAAAVFVAGTLVGRSEWQRVYASALGLGRQILQRESVAADAQAADDARRDRRYHGVVPELLARVDVGDVHFDERGAEQGAGVPDRVRVMRPRTGIEYDRSLLVRSLVQPREHLVLGVGLPDLGGEAQVRPDPHAHLGKSGVGGKAVDVGLSRAKATQVGSIEDVDLHRDTSR
jgi:hypothetical protein